MAKKRKGISLVTPKFRVSFPKVFEPEFNNLSKKDEYSISALFDKNEDISELKNAARKVCEDAWGPDPKRWPKKWKNPFKDQLEAEKENEDGSSFMPDGYVKGATMIRMKSKNQPGVVDKKKKPILDAEEFYAGCYARADVYISVYEVEDGLSVGVSVSLNHLQKVADGEPFSGRRKAEDAFSAIEGDEETESVSEEEAQNPFS